MDTRHDIDILLDQFKSNLKELDEFDFDFLLLLANGEKMTEGRLFYDLHYSETKKGKKVNLDQRILESIADQLINQFDIASIEKWIESDSILKLDFEYNKKVSSLIKNIPQLIKEKIKDKFENLWNDDLTTLRALRDFTTEEKDQLKTFIFNAIVFSLQGDISFKVQKKINDKAQILVDKNVKLFPPVESQTTTPLQKAPKRQKTSIFSREKVDTKVDSKDKDKDKKKDKHDKKSGHNKSAKR